MMRPELVVIPQHVITDTDPQVNAEPLLIACADGTCAQSRLSLRVFSASNSNCGVRVSRRENPLVCRDSWGMVSGLCVGV